LERQPARARRQTEPRKAHAAKESRLGARRILSSFRFLLMLAWLRVFYFGALSNKKVSANYAAFFNQLGDPGQWHLRG
jgi:hypothetical protein